MPRSDEAKCVVCGCTESRACPEGCAWAFAAPPVCTSCVPKFMLAAYARLLFALEAVEPELAGGKGVAAAAARDLKAIAGETRKLYGTITQERADALGIPSLREIRAIQRRVAKWGGANW